MVSAGESESPACIYLLSPSSLPVGEILQDIHTRRFRAISHFLPTDSQKSHPLLARLHARASFFPVYSQPHTQLFFFSPRATTPCSCSGHTVFWQRMGLWWSAPHSPESSVKSFPVPPSLCLAITHWMSYCFSPKFFVMETLQGL